MLSCSQRIEDADKNWIQIIETELTDLSRIAEIKLWIKTFFEKESEVRKDLQILHRNVC